MTARVKIPAGEKITISHGKLQVPDHPIIAVHRGRRHRPRHLAASVRVLDAAVEQAYKGRRKIAWAETYAGEKAQAVYGADCPPNLLPQETLDVIREYLVAIKGPLTTPVGEGFRSLNVTLRQVLDLYVCLRPVRYFKGVPSPVKRPEKIDMVIFRENTEDIYAGIEWLDGHARGQEGHRLPPEGDGRQQDPLPGHLVDRHQARLEGRLGAADPRGHALRRREQPEERHPRAQGQYPEVHGGHVHEVGIRAGQARVLRQAGALGRLRRQAARRARSSSRTPSPTRSSSRS